MRLWPFLPCCCDVLCTLRRWISHLKNGTSGTEAAKPPLMVALVQMQSVLAMNHWTTKVGWYVWHMSRYSCDNESAEFGFTSLLLSTVQLGLCKAGHFFHWGLAWEKELDWQPNSQRKAFQQECRAIVQPWWHAVALRKENRLRREGLLDARKFEGFQSLAEDLHVLASCSWTFINPSKSDTSIWDHFSNHKQFGMISIIPCTPPR